MFSQELLSSFKQTIEWAKNIAIFGHENVDGDAVGSMLWLGKICEKLGKNVWYYTTITPSRSYDFLRGIQKITTDFDYSENWDLIIYVDFFEYKRIKKITEWHEEYFDAKPMLIVDHHIGETWPKNAIVLKEDTASSTCELLYEICNELFPQQIDADVATYFYLGIVTDTGNFQYETDTARTMTNAIWLIKHGAKKSMLMQYIFNNTEPTALDLLKMIVPRITMDKHICYARYTVEEIERLGFDKDEADILILGNIKPIKNIPVFAIIRAGDTEAGMSLRSGYMAYGERINVQKIALALWGGGHIYAAGCRQPLEWEFETQLPKLVEMINNEIEKQL